MATKRESKAHYMISAVAQKYNKHPQTLRLYEREGLLQPSRTDGNTRLYGEEDLERLETILALTRDLGVNMAGVEIILNMRQKIELMQQEVNEFVGYVKQELARGLGDWEQRLGTALVKASPTDLVRAVPVNAPRAVAASRLWVVPQTVRVTMWPAVALRGDSGFGTHGLLTLWRHRMETHRRGGHSEGRPM